eukprot:g5553.t1
MKAFFLVLLFATVATFARDLTQSGSSVASTFVSTTTGGITVTNSTTVVSDGRSVVVRTESSDPDSESSDDTGSTSGTSTTRASRVEVDSSTPSDDDSASGLVDVYFLVDTTRGMERALRVLRRNSARFIDSVYDVADEVRVGVGEYKDKGDPIVFNTILSPGSNQRAAVRAINSLKASGGGATVKEAQLYALERLATNASVGFDTNAMKIVVWIGDQPGKNPVLGSKLRSAISALQKNDIHVIAIDIRRLNKLKQASRIARATSGLYRRVNIRAKSSRSASVAVSNEGGTATASGSGDRVVVSGSVGGQSETARSSDTPLIHEVILQSIKSLVS